MRTSQTDKLKKGIVAKLSESSDVIFQTMKWQSKEVELIYIKSLCDGEVIQTKLINSFFEIKNISEFQQYLHSLMPIEVSKQVDPLIEQLTKGMIVILVQNNVIVLDVKKYAGNTIFETNIETTVQGPKNSLSEDIELNTNIIRHRYHNGSLILKEKTVGKKSNTTLLLMYDKDLVDQEVLNKLEIQIDGLQVDVVQSTGQLARMLTKGKRLFPTILLTERPDRIAFNISKGKIIILLEGTPFALILPSVFYDFMSAMDDIYQSYWITKFLIVLRYFGLLISVITPALYVGIVSYNPEIFRVQLALSIAGSRISVPYPSYIEVFFMLITMELLVEASIRLPKTIGGTATTVGGLILGQAATEAGLISNIMVIIVSAVAISNFVIPINEMGFAMRVVKYILLVFSIFGGLVGVIVGLLALIAYLVNQDSFGKPYLKIFTGEGLNDE